MKKLPLIAVSSVAVLGLAWAGASWWTGYKVEEQVQLVLAEPLSGGMFHNLTLVEYQRGILSSSARFHVSLVPGVLSDPGTDNSSVFEFDANIQHGPLPLSRLVSGAWSPVLARASAVPLPGGAWQPWFDAASGRAPLLVDVDASFDGEVTFQARMAPIELAHDGARLTVSGVEASGKMTPDFGLLELQGKVAEAKLLTQAEASLTDTVAETFTGPQDSTAELAAATIPLVAPVMAEPANAPPTELVFRDVRWQSHNHRGSFGLYPGQIEIQVKRLDIATTDDLGEPLALALHDYRTIGELQEQGEMLVGRLQSDVDRLEVSGLDFGRLDATLRFDRLHGPTVQQIVANYHDLTSGAAPGSPVLPDREALDAWWQDSIEALLPTQPVFALDPLSWELAQGKSSIQVEVSLQPTVDPVFGFSNVAGLDARVVLSRPMAVEVLAQLSQLQGGTGLNLEQARAAASLNVGFVQRLALASGYVTADKDTLMTHLAYADGKFSLNGKLLELSGNWMRWLPVPR